MTRTLAVAMLLAAAAPAPAAPPADAAELFPADTLAYLELTRPGETADALAALLKATPLADSIRFTHDRLDAVADGGKAPAVRRAARLGLLASPEVLAEVRRTRGAAVGLTGFADTGEPRLAAAVLLGDSPLLAFAARSFLTAGPDLRRVAAVDGVPVFQHRRAVGTVYSQEGKPLEPDDDANPLKGRKPTAGTGEPTYAWVDGLFAVGSDVDAVADVLKRYAGRGTGPGLAAGPWKASRRADPGAAFFADPAALFAKLDAANKAAGRPADPDAVAWVRFLADPRAVRRMSGHLHLQPDAIGLTASFDLAPGVPSPAFDLLNGRLPAGIGAAPPDAAWAVTLALPQPARRAEAVLALADAAAKANGTVGRLPSEAAAADTGFDPRDLFAGVAAVTAFQPAKQTLPDGVSPWPAVIVHAADEAAAARWEQSVPALVKWMSGTGEVPTPSSETVAGVRVRTVPGADLPWAAAVHYARGGNAVGFALDRTVAADAVKRTGGSAPADAAAVGVIRPMGLAALLPPPPKPDAPPDPGRPRLLPDLSDNLVPVAMPGESFAVGLLRSAKPLPPVEMALTRTGDTVRLEVRQRGMVKPLGEAVRDFLLWLETRPPGDPVTGEPPLAEVED